MNKGNWCSPTDKGAVNPFAFINQHKKLKKKSQEINYTHWETKITAVFFFRIKQNKIFYYTVKSTTCKAAVLQKQQTHERKENKKWDFSFRSGDTELLQVSDELKDQTCMNNLRFSEKRWRR